MNLLNKKILPIAFASILCLGTVACGKTDAPIVSNAPAEPFVKTFAIKDNGEVSESEETPVESRETLESDQTENNAQENAGEDTEEETKEENPLLGHYDGDIYENEFFGIGYELKDATWNYLSEEEIMQDQEGAKEWMNSEDIAAALDSGKVFTAMNATPLDGRSSVRITVEKNSPYVRKTSEEAYLKQVMDTLPQYLEAWSAEDISMELHPMNVFGEEHNTLWISCTINGAPFQEAQAVIFCDNYIVTCGVAGSRGMEDTASLLEGFYALPEE